MKAKKAGRTARNHTLSTFLAGITGSEVAEEVLLYLAINGEGYPRGIEATTGLRVSNIAAQLQRLEVCGLLVRRTIGRTTLFSFSTRGEDAKLFAELVKRIASRLPEKRKTQLSERVRPRLSGKELVSREGDKK